MQEYVKGFEMDESSVRKFCPRPSLLSPLYRLAPVLFFPLRLFLPLEAPDADDPDPPAPPPLMNETNSSTSKVPLAPMLDRAPLADDSAADDGGSMVTFPDWSTFRYRPRPPS